MVAFIKNFFAKRRFLKTIHDFEKAMEVIPALAANLKVSIPNVKKTLKTVMSRAEYKQKLQELQKATRSSIDEMTNALTSAKDFLATHPTAFNAKDKAMYDKKIQSFEAFKVKYEYELHTIFAATPSPVAASKKVPRVKEFCSSKNYKSCIDDKKCQWVRYQGCQTRI